MVRKPEKIQNHKQLRVWQEAYKFSLMVYDLATKLPPEEKYNLASQLRRAALSIPTNIVEGFYRYSPKEFVRYLKVSYSSLGECESLVGFGRARNYFTEQDTLMAKNQAIKVAKLTNALIKTLLSKIKNSPR